MADNIQATPRNYLGGLLSDAYKWMQSPQRTQQMQGFAGLLGTTGLPQTIERMAYGEPLTNIGRANVPLLKPETADALMTVAPMVGPAARGAEAGLLSAGRAGERLAERVVPQVMERGGLPAQLLGDLSQGNKRQVLAYHGTNAQEILAPKSSLENMYDRTGFTGWFSESPELANYYSLARGVEGGAVMPVDIKMKKPLKLNFDMNDSPEEAMKIAEKLGLDRDFFPNVFSDKNKRAFEVVNDRNFKQAALEAGYDSIQVPEEGVMTFAPLMENANQVKSVFDLKQKGLLGEQVKSASTLPTDYYELNTMATQAYADLRAKPSQETADYYKSIMKARDEAANNPSNNYTPPVQDVTPQDYRGQHAAPIKDSGAPLWKLDDIYPEDFYSNKGAQYYGDGAEPARDAMIVRQMQSMKGRPNAPVTIYRAVPKSVPTKEALNTGDWITLDRQYAKEHGEGALNGDYKIVSKTVKARDLFTNGDSIYEMGYDPQPRVKKAIQGLLD